MLPDPSFNPSPDPLWADGASASDASLKPPAPPAVANVASRHLRAVTPQALELLGDQAMGWARDPAPSSTAPPGLQTSAGLLRIDLARTSFRPTSSEYPSQPACASPMPMLHGRPPSSLQTGSLTPTRSHRHSVASGTQAEYQPSVMAQRKVSEPSWGSAANSTPLPTVGSGFSSQRRSLTLFNGTVV
eukprot:CAMPEP_0202876858 /NCGR_PEP_ID=MMETSP1391-20130828/29725_1 /ASSEMBLY_ACC=CAM_ASM_000867 /TAXON_ID=1034604 /ORGANISM="Chlamydomonas leiostraca, Strain SAG 11-49" /LENGTH=187 /DNA_ID=CAMNT_0049558793 /DNA_START=175 /DNA_END=735 /DNA_ORIENTATION=+